MSETVTGTQAAGDASDNATASRNVQVTRWVATIAGLIGATFVGELGFSLRRRSPCASSFSASILMR